MKVKEILMESFEYVKKGSLVFRLRGKENVIYSS